MPLEPQRHITENSCLLKESRSSLKYSRRLSESESVFSSDHRTKVKAKLTVDAENFDEAWFSMDLGSGPTVFLGYETVSDLHVDNIPNVRFGILEIFPIRCLFVFFRVFHKGDEISIVHQSQSQHSHYLWERNMPFYHSCNDCALQNGDKYHPSLYSDGIDTVLIEEMQRRISALSSNFMT